MAFDRLQTIVECAIKSFELTGTKGNKILGAENFSNLISAVNNIKLMDVSFPPAFIRNHARSPNPIDHLPIFNNNNVTVGVFIMNTGSKIPLHDHPGMYGILKVLSGRLKVSSYDIVQFPVNNLPSTLLYYSSPLLVSKKCVTEVNENSNCLYLDPRKRNIHEVVCLAGPAAFLDVLGPPYDDDVSSAVERSCHYFKICDDSEVDGQKRLMQVRLPHSYWSDGEE